MYETQIVAQRCVSRNWKIYLLKDPPESVAQSSPVNRSGHAQMYPFEVLLSATQVPPLEQGLGLQLISLSNHIRTSVAAPTPRYKSRDQHVPYNHVSIHCDLLYQQLLQILLIVSMVIQIV